MVPVTSWRASLIGCRVHFIATCWSSHELLMKQLNFVGWNSAESKQRLLTAGLRRHSLNEWRTSEVRGCYRKGKITLPQPLFFVGESKVSASAGEHYLEVYAAAALKAQSICSRLTFEGKMMCQSTYKNGRKMHLVRVCLSFWTSRIGHLKMYEQGNIIY